jgi:hypothetical protein
MIKAITTSRNHQCGSRKRSPSSPAPHLLHPFPNAGQWAIGGRPIGQILGRGSANLSHTLPRAKTEAEPRPGTPIPRPARAMSVGVSAAAGIAEQHRVPLAVFPAGTFNHFAKDALSRQRACRTRPAGTAAGSRDHRPLCGNIIPALPDPGVSWYPRSSRTPSSTGPSTLGCGPGFTRGLIRPSVKCPIELPDRHGEGV